MTTKRNTELLKHHKEIIDGLLLGDGSVLLPNKTPYLSFTSKEIEIIKKVNEILPLSYLPLKIKPQHNRTIRNKIYNFKQTYELRSVCDKTFQEYRNLWYPEGKKVIPKDIDLTPTCVKYWFYGDGSTSYEKDNNATRVTLQFSTNCFTSNDIDILINKLILIGLNFNKHKAREGFVIRSSCANTVNRFFDYIGECDVSCYSYKWKNPIMAPTNNKFGIKGLGWKKSKQRWYVRVAVNKVRKHLGSFKNKEDAIKTINEFNLNYNI